MPTPTLPPTPAASTEIAAQERPWTSSSSGCESTLALPPPALQSATEHAPHSPNYAINTKITYPLESTNGRPLNRTASASTKKLRPVSEAGPFTLPSPPTRSRKIIQMKTPRPQPDTQSSNKRRKTNSTSTSDPPSTQKLSSSSSSSSSTNVNNASKPTKKAIRKTAHSLIERRRRSKMNEAFSTLKDMIPACRSRDDKEANGKEMHKLDVLNAGIEYLGYLEQCLERMTERRWEHLRKIETTRKAEVRQEDDAIEDSREDRRSVSTERKHKRQPEQQQHRWQDRNEREMEKDYPAAPLSVYPSHGQSYSRNEDVALTSLPPSPTLLPPLTPQDFSPSDHPIERIITHLNHEKDTARDREQDHEETKNTAAALLMLTSTDRRGNIHTATDTRPRPGPSNDYPITTSTHHHHIQSPIRMSQPRTLPYKTGLSVKDLLLK